MSEAWPAFAHQRVAGHVDLALRVTPNAGREEIETAQDRGDGEVRLRIKVRAVPEDGKANRAVCALIGKALGLPKSSVQLVSGETSRDKVVRVPLDPGLAGKLNRLGA